MTRDKLILTECLTWWNVETRGGFVCESFSDKRLARAYQRLGGRRALRNGQLWRVMRRFHATLQIVTLNAFDTEAPHHAI